MTVSSNENARMAASLEDRLVSMLSSESLIHPDNNRRTGAPIRAFAASLALLSIGAVAGHFGPGLLTERDPGQDYVLLLYGTPTDGSAETDRAREYGRWARDVDRIPKVKLLSASELADNPLMFDGAGSAPELAGADRSPVGYFLIRAPSPSEARRIAATNPHLRHGGRVVLAATQ
jgi:hypothetical protein